MMTYENLPVEVRKQLQVESKALFAEVYKSSCKVFGVGAHRQYQLTGFKNCWRDLIKVWGELDSEAATAVLYAAVYHVAWDRYPVNCVDKRMEDLLEFVEQAITAEGYAFEMWSVEPAFHQAMDVLKETATPTSECNQCKSEWFGRYIYANAYCKIGLKNRVPDMPFDGLREEDVEMFATVDRAREIPVIFEAAIKKLLPDADHWTRKQWTDEDFILNEIDSAHETNYANDPQDFDALLDLYDIQAKWKRKRAAD